MLLEFFVLSNCYLIIINKYFAGFLKVNLDIVC